MALLAIPLSCLLEIILKVLLVFEQVEVNGIVRLEQLWLPSEELGAKLPFLLKVSAYQ